METIDVGFPSLPARFNEEFERKRSKPHTSYCATQYSDMSDADLLAAGADVANQLNNILYRDDEGLNQPTSGLTNCWFGLRDAYMARQVAA